MRWIFILLCLAACTSRPLSDAERNFLQTFHGDQVDMDAVRVTQGSITSAIQADIPERPRNTCREKLYPPRSGPQTLIFPGLTVGSVMFYTEPFWSEDYLKGYPDALPLRDAMRLAHEMTHVWQWQARSRTKYHPFKALREHIAEDDPYLVDFDPDRPFLSYGWEQQGTLTEEFVCCRALDPTGAKTQALYQMLSREFPTIARRELTALADVALPWDGAEISGICS